MIMIVCLSCNCKTQTATDAYKQRLNTHTHIHMEPECMCVSLWGLLSRRFVCMNKSWRLIRNSFHGISAPVVAVVVAHNCSMSRCRCQPHTHTRAHTACTDSSKAAFWLIWQQLNLRLTRALSLSSSLSLSLCLSLAHLLCFFLIMHI